MFSFSSLFTLLLILIISFILSFTVAYKILYKHFKRNNSILIDRQREDMQLYLNANHRVKILERRLLNVLKAFRNERKSKNEILNCIHIKVHDCDK